MAGTGKQVAKKKVMKSMLKRPSGIGIKKKKKPTETSIRLDLKQEAAARKAVREFADWGLPDIIPSLEGLASSRRREMVTMHEIEIFFRSHDLVFIGFERLPHARVNMDRVLHSRHLLLHSDVANLCVETGSQMRDIERIFWGNWNAIANEVWDRCLISVTNKALQLIKKGQGRGAFGHLMGVLLYTSDHIKWLSEQEVFEDWSKFQGFFTKVSQAWQAVLKKSDRELGLASVAWAGSYRQQLDNQLMKWQTRVNGVLRKSFDKHSGVHAAARLTIF